MRGGIPRHRDIMSPKHGLISDAEQTWQAAKDYYKTIKKTKWHCRDMQQRLDFWTPFLEGMFEHFEPTMAHVWQERGEFLDQQRKVARLEKMSRSEPQDSVNAYEAHPPYSVNELV